MLQSLDPICLKISIESCVPTEADLDVMILAYTKETLHFNFSVGIVSIEPTEVSEVLAIVSAANHQSSSMGAGTR